MVLILDTCTLIFDALAPNKLSRKAKQAIDQADQPGWLACSDISLWEIAMLAAKGRLDPGTDVVKFINLLLAAKSIKVLPITPEIAHLSAVSPSFQHGDPADRIIGATALVMKGVLVTPDKQLHNTDGLKVLW